MSVGARLPFMKRGLPLLALSLFSSVAALGCDTGGLLVVEGTDAPPPKPAKVQSSTEIVSGGTTAANEQFRIVYTMGQPTPQGVSTSPTQRLNGGLQGAVNNP